MFCHVILFVVAEFVPGILPIVTVMAGFRQEDVEMYYEMGEELGRYGLYFILLTSPLDDKCLRQLEIFKQCASLAIIMRVKKRVKCAISVTNIRVRKTAFVFLSLQVSVFSHRLRIM